VREQPITITPAAQIPPSSRISATSPCSGGKRCRVHSRRSERAGNLELGTGAQRAPSPSSLGEGQRQRNICHQLPAANRNRGKRRQQPVSCAEISGWRGQRVRVFSILSRSLAQKCASCQSNSLSRTKIEIRARAPAWLFMGLVEMLRLGQCGRTNCAAGGQQMRGGVKTSGAGDQHALGLHLRAWGHRPAFVEPPRYRKGPA